MDGRETSERRYMRESGLLQLGIARRDKIQQCISIQAMRCCDKICSIAKCVCTCDAGIAHDTQVLAQFAMYGL